MTENPYEAPAIVEIGTLHELTLKDGFKLDLANLLDPGRLGPVS